MLVCFYHSYVYDVDIELCRKMTEMREPRGPSMAYTMAVGVGRGRSLDGSSVMSSSTFTGYAGRGAALQVRAAVDDKSLRQHQMANAQKPYEQYLVIACCFFTLKLVLKFRLISENSLIKFLSYL